METHTYALTITYVCVVFYIRMYIKHIGIFFTSPFFLPKKEVPLKINREKASKKTALQSLEK